MTHRATHNLTPTRLVAQKTHQSVSEAICGLNTDKAIIRHTPVRFRVAGDKCSSAHRELEPLQVTLAAGHIIVDYGRKPNIPPA
jgi:hypothetical protein